MRASFQFYYLFVLILYIRCFSYGQVDSWEMSCSNGDAMLFTSMNLIWNMAGSCLSNTLKRQKGKIQQTHLHSERATAQIYEPGVV